MATIKMPMATSSSESINNKHFSILQYRRLPVSTSLPIGSSTDTLQTSSASDLRRNISSNSIICIDMSSSMDLALIIVATQSREVTETQISLFRTLTWEKIFSISSPDIAASSNGSTVTVCSGPPTIVKFHNYQQQRRDDGSEFPQRSSRFAAVGFTNGRIAVLDLETTSFTFSVSCDSYSSLDVAISSFAWIAIGTQDSLFEENSFDRAARWRYGGIDLVRRHGMVIPTISDSVDLSISSPLGFSNQWGAAGQAKSAPHDENSGASSYLSILSGLSSWLLLSVSSRQGGMLHGHICGIYPLFSISLCHFLPVDVTLVEVVGMSTLPSGIQSKSSFLLGIDCFCSAGSNSEKDRFIVNSTSRFTSKWTSSYKWLAQSGSTQLLIESNLIKLQELVGSCSRKWKDACKAILPKLSLLQGLLETYQVVMTPVQFLYTVSMCGLWHPIALNCFSQHWNDQGLARLKTAIDSASQAIITALQLRGVAYCTNIILASRELLTLHENIIPSENGVPVDQVQKYHHLVHSAELLLNKLDDTILEARLARETMLLYVQFVKDCSAEASPTVAQQAKTDFSLRPRYFRLFDPRVTRADSTGALSQAEHVTGTHLYAYLSTADSQLPEGLLRKARQQQYHWMRGGSAMDDPEHDVGLKYILQTADSIALGEQFLSLKLRDSSFNGYSTVESNGELFFTFILMGDPKLDYLERAYDSISLSSQIKATKEIFQSVFGHLHAQQSDLLVAPPSEGSHGQQILRFVAELSFQNCDISISESTSSFADNFEFKVQVAGGAKQSVLSSCLVSAYLTSPLLDASASNKFVAILLHRSHLDSDGNEVGTSQYMTSFCLSTLRRFATQTRAVSSVPDSTKICFYSREIEGSKSFSLLLHSKIASDLTGDDLNGVYHLFRLELTGLLFTEISTQEKIDFRRIQSLDLSEKHFDSLSSRLRSRRLDSMSGRSGELGTVVLMRAQGERGIVMLCDQTNKVLILDLETDEDEDDVENASEKEEGNSSIGDQEFVDCEEY